MKQQTLFFEKKKKEKKKTECHLLQFCMKLDSSELVVSDLWVKTREWTIKTITSNMQNLPSKNLLTGFKQNK